MIKHKRLGLTLIELLAVIAIIAILFILLIPQVTKAIDKSRVSGVQVDLHSYEVGMRSYFMEHFGEEKTAEALNKYLDKSLQFEEVNNKWVSKVETNPYDVKYELTTDGLTYMQVNSYTDEKDPRIHAVRVYEDGNEVNSIYIGFDDEKKKSEVDTEAPVIKISPDGGEDIEVVFVDVTDNVEVFNIQYVWSTQEKLTNAQWQSIENNTELSTVFLGKGNYYLHIKASDLDMNTSYESSKAFVLGDSIPPVITVTVNGSDEEKIKHSTIVSATDNKGVAKMEYAWSDVRVENQVNTPWTTFKNGSEISTPPISGGLYLHVKVTDISGLETYYMSDMFKTGDSEDPVITLSPNGNATEKFSHTTVVTVTDNDAVNTVKYIWSKETTKPTTGWTNTTSGATLTTPTFNGNLYLYIEATDRTGNTANLKSQPFKTGDSQNPVVSLSVNGNATFKDVHTTVVTVTDNDAVKTVKYAWSTSTAIPTTGWTNTTSGSTLTTPTMNGDLYLHIEATDRVGNKTEFISQPFKTGDTVFPVVTLTPNGNTTQKLTHTTKIVATDNKGIKKIEYVWSESETEPTTGWKITTSGTTVTSTPTDGNVYLYVKAEDVYGNIKTFKSNVFMQSPYIYTVGTDGTTITAYKGTQTDIIIPSMLGGEKVISIEKSAFFNRDLTSIVIPNSVTLIGQEAFRFNQLTSVTIPNSVTSIGVGAFQQNQLTSVTIPNSVTSIGNSAFHTNELLSIDIGNSVTSIGTYSFYKNQLTSVTIPKSVTTIGASAFKGNTNLKTVQNCSNLNVIDHFGTSSTITKTGC